MRKDLKPAKHPVIINVRGGFFAGGHALFSTFFSPWAADLAVERGAVIISADYHLLPSPNGIADQLEDLEDLWQWTRKSSPAVFERHARGHTLDFDSCCSLEGRRADTMPRNSHCLIPMKSRLSA